MIRVELLTQCLPSTLQAFGEIHNKTIMINKPSIKLIGPIFTGLNILPILPCHHGAKSNLLVLIRSERDRSSTSSLLWYWGHSNEKEIFRWKKKIENTQKCHLGWKFQFNFRSNFVISRHRAWNPSVTGRHFENLWLRDDIKVRYKRIQFIP